MGTRVPLNSQHLCDKSLIGLSQLLDDFLKLSEDQDSADIVFLLRDDERIYAHRVILLARCKSFQNAKREVCRIPGSSVSTSTSSQPIQIRLNHVHPEVFRQFIVYIYTGKIIFQDSTVFEMMTLAQDMGVDELRIACEDYVVSTLSVVNACKFLMSVMEMQEKASGAKCTASFHDRCISFIGEHARDCVKTNAFLNLTKDGIIKLVSSDYFSLEEEEVWRAVLAWAKHHASVTKPTSHWTEEEKVRVCQHLSGIMVHVRLLLIDSQVFAEEVEPTGAVPMELSLERYRFAALKSKQTLPGQNVSFSGGPLPENDKRLQPRLLINLFPGSNILKNDKLHLQGILNGWYGVPKQNWQLVYRASAHNFSATAFHRMCDGISPTFIIAMGSEGEISGGFSDVAWAKTSRKLGYIHSENAFLFALNPANDGPYKYDVIKKPYAICYHPDCGPIFGAGADLLLSNGCNSNMESYSNLPHSYDGPNASSTILFGDYNFTINEYEVYTLAVSSVFPGVKVKNDHYQ